MARDRLHRRRPRAGDLRAARHRRPARADQVPLRPAPPRVRGRQHALSAGLESMSAESRGKLIETLSVLIIIVGIVAIGIPKWTDLQRREQAQRMLADVEIVREAVYRFYSDSAVFPREAPGGQFAEELEFYLPATFTRSRPYGTIEYRNWPLTVPMAPADSTVTDKPKASNVI